MVGRPIWMLLILVASLATMDSILAQQPQPEDAPQPTSVVTVEQIETASSQVDQAAELEDAAKVELKETYSKAKAELEKAAKYEAEAAQFETSAEGAAANLNAAEEEKTTQSGYDFTKVQGLDLNELNRDRSALEQQLTATKEQLLKTQAEPQRRVERIAKIPDELAAAQLELGKIESELEAIESDEDTDPAVIAAQTLLRARRQATQALITRLQNERAAYEAEGELPRLRGDILTARMKQLEQDIRKLVDVTTQRRATDAAAQKASAEEALQTTPDSLKPIAQGVIDLADRRLVLANEIQLASVIRAKTDQQLIRWVEDFERTTKRIENLGATSIGPTLVEKRTTLPSIAYLREQVAQEESRLTDAQVELYYLEDRRADLADINAATRTTMDELAAKAIILPEDAEKRLKEMLEVEVRVLDGLLNDANRYYSLLITARDNRRKLVDVIRDYRDYIDREIFWIRTAEPLGLSHGKDSVDGLRWLFSFDTLDDAIQRMGGRFRRSPIETLLLLALIGVLIRFRLPIRRMLEQLGEAASRVSCITMVPTLRSLLLTLSLAATWPLVCWFLGWMLDGAVMPRVRALSTGLNAAALWLLMLELVRQVYRPGGLAQSHFGWPVGQQDTLRRALRWLVAVGTPLVFLCSGIYRHGELESRVSIGRVCLVFLLLLISFTLFRFFRSTANTSPDASASRPGRFRKLWLPLAVASPAVLAVMSISGMQYTAFQLTQDALYSFSFLFVLYLLTGIAFRWVRIRRRSIRWQQLVEAQQHRESELETSDLSDIAALVGKEEETDLVAMDRQSRRLISWLFVTVGAAGLLIIWRQVIPALESFLQSPVDPFAAITDGQGVTVGQLLKALIVLFLAIVGWRNIPGLVDVLLLGRMGVESSIRYAITTLSQYAIGIVGAIVACGSLGMSWGQVQWLVAAMGVGLGFGLQEVVANFVCGVLLLFERPIRVGDTVTLGETTGIVVRIRSRATTIRNWDRQEVIIPNKELVTGRITNWTLSDDMNRIVIQVGVAYGSDTDYARQLLYEVLTSNPNIIDDPRPLVHFEQFGDSTLNFTVRAYLAKMDDRLETVHQLHTAIHKRFQDEGIEIAFPQRDLHIRSLAPEVSMGEAAAQPIWRGSGDGAK